MGAGTQGITRCPCAIPLAKATAHMHCVPNHPTRGAACSNFTPQPGAKTFAGLEGGGRWVGRSAAGVPRRGSVGIPTYIPQNDPHDALIILNIHKKGKKIFHKKLPISSDPHPGFLCFSNIFEFSTKF